MIFILHSNIKAYYLLYIGIAAHTVGFHTDAQAPELFYALKKHAAHFKFN